MKEIVLKNRKNGMAVLLGSIVGLLLGISSMNAEDEARDIDRLALSET